MKFNPEDFPNIEFHPSWNILDSSKITAYQLCPRKFFYRYILGWEPDFTSLALIFGESWHRAKEYLLVNGVELANLQFAMTLFLDYYRQSFGEDDDQMNRPKDPGTALKALTDYVLQHRKNYEVIGTEISGAAPLNDEHSYVFRLDLVKKDKRGIVVVDHKTTGSSNPMYEQLFQMSFQVSAYIHAARCHFGFDQVWGLEIERTLFQKTQQKHTTIPIRKIDDMNEDWLLDAIATVEKMQAEYERLSSESPADYKMCSFQKNENGCSAYFSLCPYFDFCCAWANPLKKAGETPIGFRQKFWDPTNREEKSSENSRG